MNDQDMLLSEYLDGELEPGLKTELERVLARDSALAHRLDYLSSLRPAAKTLPYSMEESSQRVWTRLQWSTHHGSHRHHPAFALLQRINQRVSLPMPALAAMFLVVLGLGSLLVFQPGKTPGMVDLAQSSDPYLYTVNNGFNIQTQGSSPSAQSGGDGTNPGYEVTFEVDNLQQLMNILEGRESIQELRIQMPSLVTLPENQAASPPVLQRLEMTTGTAGVAQ